MKKYISLLLALVMIFGMVGRLPVSAADVTYWHTNWAKVGIPAPVENESQITIQGIGANAQSHITLKEANLGGKITAGNFDVEWTMKMNRYSGSENFQVRTGDSRLYLIFSENQLVCRTTKEDNTAGAVTIPFAPGYDWHTYRAISHNGVCSLYADDLFLAEFPLHKTSCAVEVHAWVMGTASQNSSMTLSNVTVRSLTDGFDTSAYTPATVTDSFNYTFNTTKDGFSAGNWSWNSESENGFIECENTVAGTTPSAYKNINIGANRDFVLSARMAFPALGGTCGMQLFWPGRALYLDIHPLKITTRDGTAEVTNHSAGDGNWHDFRIETRNAGVLASLYVDDVLVKEFETQESARKDCHLYFYVGASQQYGKSYMKLDSVSLTTQMIEAKVLTPYHGAVYQEGQDISVSAVEWNSGTVATLDYYLNGQKVATGSAPDYRATLPALPAGIYQLVAKSGSVTSGSNTFTVVSAFAGEIMVEKIGKKNQKISVALSGSGNQNVAQVEYLLDGQPIGTGEGNDYAMILPDLGSKTCTIAAICKNQAGMMIGKLYQEIVPELGGEFSPSEHYANEVSYTIAGTAGNAEINLQNGSYQIWMQHQANNIIYQTDEGQATYQGDGYGNFVIFTDGPVAEVYRNGQMIFSYYMPKTMVSKRCFYENGLLIQNYQVRVTPERQNYFVKDNVKDQKKIYDLSGLGYDYVLDFVADQSEETRLVVTDGVFQTDLALEDGKFYVWTRHNDFTEPYRMELCDAPNRDNVYYRVEVSAGMCRLLADGRWIGSFRSIYGQGAPNIAIDVSAGELSHLAVREYEDVYIYEDSFDGKGSLDSFDFWLQKGISLGRNLGEGVITLTGAAGGDRILNLNTFVGNAVFETEVELTSCTGGFWLLANHSVSKTYTKIGYNFATEQYEIVEVDNAPTDTITAPGSFPIGTKVKMKLVVEKTADDKILTLYVDGEKVISKKGAMMHQGKLGFVLDGGNARVHSVSYRGDAKPVVDMSDTTNRGYFDFIEPKTGGVLGLGGGAPYLTTDGGKTWTKYRNSQGEGDSAIMVQLKTGEIVSAIREPSSFDAAGVYNSYISRDEGATWEKQGSIMPSALAGRATMPNHMTQGRSERIYFPSCENNNEDYGHTVVYYSDDKGYTWTASETVMDAKETGFCIQEVVVLEMVGGQETRAYFRNEFGMVCYFVSKDRGVTWDLTPRRTPFFSNLNCFGIDFDPHDETTLYASWGYDNANLHSTNQLNRTRWSVAKSVDNGETWEYLGTVHENNNTTTSGSRMMNLTNFVTKDYLFMNAMSNDNLETPNAWIIRNIGISKQKQVGSKRFEKLHVLNQNQVKKLKQAGAAKESQALMIDANSNNIVLKGNWISGAVYQGRVQAEYLADLVGATVKVNGGTVNLCYGKAETAISADKVTTYQGKYYLDVDAFATSYGLAVIKESGITIVSSYAHWPQAQKKALIHGINPFADSK